MLLNFCGIVLRIKKKVFKLFYFRDKVVNLGGKTRNLMKVQKNVLNRRCYFELNFLNICLWSKNTIFIIKSLTDVKIKYFSY